LGIAVRLRSDATRRWGSATLALLLHLLLLLGLLRSLTAPVRIPRATPREMILRLLPMLKSAPTDNAAPPAVASPQLRSRVMPVVPPPVGSAAAPSLSAPLSNLGQSLFGCAPENLGNLSREQRAHCATGLARPDDSVMGELPSHVKDPRRRAAEMAAKNAPAKVPCTYMTNAPAPYGGVVPVPMTSLDCLRDRIVNDGFRPLNGLDK
jgi:hypothetical protein